MARERAQVPEIPKRQQLKAGEYVFAPRAAGPFGEGATRMGYVISRDEAGLYIVQELRPNQLNWERDEETGTMSVQLLAAESATNPGTVRSTRITSGQPLESHPSYKGALEVEGQTSDFIRVIGIEEVPPGQDPSKTLTPEEAASAQTPTEIRRIVEEIVFARVNPGQTRERAGATPDALFAISRRGTPGLAVLVSVVPDQGLLLTTEGMSNLNSILTYASLQASEFDFRGRVGRVPLAMRVNTRFASYQLEDFAEFNFRENFQVVGNEGFEREDLPVTALPLGFAGRALVEDSVTFAQQEGVLSQSELDRQASLIERLNDPDRSRQVSYGRLVAYDIANEAVVTLESITGKDQCKDIKLIRGRTTPQAPQETQASKERRGIEALLGGPLSPPVFASASGSPFRDLSESNTLVTDEGRVICKTQVRYVPENVIDVELLQGTIERTDRDRIIVREKKKKKDPKEEKDDEDKEEDKDEDEEEKRENCRPPKGPGDQAGDKNKKGGGSRQQRSPSGGTKEANDQAGGGSVPPEGPITINPIPGLGGFTAGQVFGDILGPRPESFPGTGGGKSSCPKPPKDTTRSRDRAGDPVTDDSIDVSDDFDLGEFVALDDVALAESIDAVVPELAEGGDSNKPQKKCPKTDDKNPQPSDEIDLSDPQIGTAFGGIDPDADTAQSLAALGEIPIVDAVAASFDGSTNTYVGFKAALGIDYELGGNQGDDRVAVLKDSGGRYTAIEVPAPGDKVQPSAMASLINMLKPEGTRTTPLQGEMGAPLSVRGQLDAVQREVRELHDLIDAVFVGDRFSNYGGNMVVMATNKPIDPVTGEGQGVSENYLGVHLIDPRQDTNDSTPAGLNVLQAIEGRKRNILVSRAAFRATRNLSGNVQVKDDGMGRPVVAAEKFLTDGARDRAPWFSAWLGEGQSPPWAVVNSGAVALAPIGRVPEAELIDGSAYFLNRQNLPFFQTAGKNGRLVDLSAFQGFDGIVVSDYAEGFTSWNVDEDGNVIVSSEAEQARLGYPSF